MKVLLALLVLFVFNQVSVAGQKEVIYLHKDGVGKITKTTEPEIKVLKKIYPQFTYKKGPWVWEMEANPAIYVYDGSTLAMTIIIYEEKKKIGAIIVTSSKIKNSLGPNLNDEFKKVFKDKPYLNYCEQGLERDHNKVMCEDPSFKNILYAFTSKTYRGRGVMPPIETLNTLRISEMGWTAGDEGSSPDENILPD